jgi:hypothetical protein
MTTQKIKGYGWALLIALTPVAIACCALIQSGQTPCASGCNSSILTAIGVSGLIASVIWFIIGLCLINNEN